jgi:hypothetical protein
MTRPDYALIHFVRCLHDIASDLDSEEVHCVHEAEAQERCRRWMDAVLPPPKGTNEVPFPEELKKAAQ